MHEHHKVASYLLKINTGGVECCKVSVVWLSSDLLHYFIIDWMVRDSLCELQRRQGNIELVAFLACDIKQ